MLSMLPQRHCLPATQEPKHQSPASLCNPLIPSMTSRYAALSQSFGVQRRFASPEALGRMWQSYAKGYCWADYRPERPERTAGGSIHQVLGGGPLPFSVAQVQQFLAATLHAGQHVRAMLALFKPIGSQAADVHKQIGNDSAYHR